MLLTFHPPFDLIYHCRPAIVLPSHLTEYTSLLFYFPISVFVLSMGLCCWHFLYIIYALFREFLSVFIFTSLPPLSATIGFYTYHGLHVGSVDESIPLAVYS